MASKYRWLLLTFVMSLSAALGAGCSGDDDADAESADDDVDDDAGNVDDDAVDDDAVDDDATPPSEEVLLDRYQPLLVQKLAADYETAGYPPESDLIGRLSLHPGDDRFDHLVEVDTDAPVMYRFAATAEIRGRTYQQLLYEFFYPERPLLHSFAEDPVWYLAHWWDAGAIDGKVVRVTLDTDNATPLFIEFMQSCGCGWKFFVNRIVEDAARQEFAAAGEDFPGLAKPEAPHDVPYVFVMPADVPDAQTFPVVMDEAGWTDSAHEILAAFTSYAQWLAADEAVDPGVLYVPDQLGAETPNAAPLDVQTYQPLPYAPLYTMSPAGSGDEVGIFDEYGYIWNAYSPFWLMLRNLTNRDEFPGTPRDPAAFEVVHETMDFWDQETLFDTFIYLPESIFGPAQ